MVEGFKISLKNKNNKKDKGGMIWIIITCCPG